MHCLALSRQIGHYHNARFRAAAARFDRFTVLSCAGEGFFSEFSAQNFDGYAVETLADGRDAYAEAVKSGEFIGRVAQTLDRLQPEAVAVPGWASAESFAALIWARKNRVPVVTMAESQQDDVARSALKEGLKGHIVRQFDAALAGGYSTCEYLVALGMAKERVALGYNAVDNAHFTTGAETARQERHALLNKHGLPKRYFLASARFITKKNLPALVRAYGQARAQAGTRDEFPDLVILGDGPQKAEIETAIQTEGLGPNVHLPGFRGYDVLPIFYGLSAGFLHVATREQWGLVINEAMASSVPVVASDRCGATRTVMDKSQGGYVVDPTDTAAIAAAIGDLAALSPQDHVAMGQAAHAAIADWGPDRFGQGMAQAVATANSLQRRGALAVWDRLLLTRMARQVYANVD